MHILGLALVVVLAPAASAADPDAFLQMLPAATPRTTDALFGATLFRARWDAGAALRPGLGPDFDAVSCHECHPRAGRGVAEHAHVLRLEPADERYGDSLSRRAIAGRRPEATVSLRTVGAAPSDDSARRLQPAITHLGRGALSPETTVSLRIAPQLAGLGLLEAIPAAAIVAGTDPDDRDGDGISGRAAGAPAALGRFGWRAEMPSIREQVVRALAVDMDVHTDAAAEITATDVDRLATFVRLLAPPATTALDPTDEADGARLFAELGCPRCHVPTWTTGVVDGAPELSGRTIHPYTDLLLHDLGDGLADRRVDGRPSAREWRTPPLWGLGQIAPSDDRRLLHDGRARTVLEAVGWHGGEADMARRRTQALDPSSRAQLERFVLSR